MSTPGSTRTTPKTTAPQATKQKAQMPYETQIRPDLIESLCQVAGVPLPSGAPAGRRMVTLALDVHLATWYHLEARRVSGLVRSGKRFGPRRNTVSGLIVDALSLRLPNPDDYVRLAEAMVRRRQNYGDTTVSVRVPMRPFRLIEALAETLPSRKGIGFLSPKAVAEVLVLASAASNTENPFLPDRAPVVLGTSTHPRKSTKSSVSTAKKPKAAPRSAPLAKPKKAIKK